ncbi:MAG: two-component system response regulator [Planctomycetota bacterium]|nr:MAG: two-component system response regulator [Planctomycetota bacterium]
MLTLTSSTQQVLEGLDDHRPASLRVLLIDDDHLCSAQVRRLLQQDRLEVESRVTAEAGLEAARQAAPDVILLDLELPSMTGFEALQLLRSDARCSHVAVVVISARDDARTRAAAFAAGADCFLAKPLSQDEVRAAVLSLGGRGRLLRDREEAASVLDALARILDLRVPGSRAHMQRAAQLARRFGEWLEFSPEDCLALERAGWLHDVGKIALPASILNKPGPLDAAEVRIMRRHPVLGERICARLRTLGPVLPVIRHHHEHWDGSGYPDRLAGEQVPLITRAFQVVDVFDALVSKRSYKESMPASRALEILEAEARRGLWDPSLVADFCAATRAGELDTHR